MISNGEGQHYIAVKQLSALLRGTKQKNNDDIYCLNCLYFFKTKKTNLIRIKNYKYKNFCNAKIEGPKILDLINTRNPIKHHLLFMQILNL